MIPIPEDSELQPADTIPIKKPEFREQARLVAALRRKWSVIADRSIKPIVFAVPNGGSRDAREACNLKTQGLLAGMPDLGILCPNARTVWIEMKAEDGRVSALQADLHPHIADLGFDMIVAYSAEDALAQLRKIRWMH
jgi:VRR-NUC domain